MAAGFLTTAQAAERLGLTIRAVQKMIEAGRLEGIKAGRDYLIKTDALEKITRKSKAGRPPKKATKRSSIKKTVSKK